MIKLRHFIGVLSGGIEIRIRSAFISGYSENDYRPDYFNGVKKDIPQDFKYFDRPVISVYGWNEHGDTIGLKDAYALDIAIGDIDED